MAHAALGIPRILPIARIICLEMPSCFCVWTIAHLCTVRFQIAVLCTVIWKIAVFDAHTGSLWDEDRNLEDYGTKICASL